jgi:transposase InsO family protein
MLVSWTISTRPDAEMVNSMLDLAADKLSEEERPIVHSDRGSHYRWPGWIERIAGYDLTQSMSKKGCSADNAACEGLFGRIKNEMFYNRSWKNVSLDSFIDILDRYLYWYNNLRIKMSLNGMSPVNYRLSWVIPLKCQENIRHPDGHKTQNPPRKCIRIGTEIQKWQRTNLQE